MRKRLMVFVFMTFIFFFVGIMNVFADYCTECAEKNGGKCGLCGQSCAVNDKGVCTINSHDQELWDEAAKSGCSGYQDNLSCAVALNGACVWNGKDSCLEKETANCLSFKDSTSCKKSPNFACVWVENDAAPGGGYCNVDNLLYVGCGGAQDIPMQIPSLISMLVNLLKIATPIILIFISMITLFKAMTAGKEDEIKKATSSLIKKIVAAAMVFFVIAIVQFIVSKVAEDDEYAGFEDCLNCFLNNSCTQTSYYKTVVSGVDNCTPLTTGVTDTCENMFKSK